MFCVWPFVATVKSSDPRLLFDEQAPRLIRTQECTGQQVTFELDTSGIVNGQQANLTPSEGPQRDKALLNMPPREQFPGLVALAEEWLGVAGLPRDDRLHRAMHLERMLANSGRFKYSLQGQPRDRSLDPIEDFITKHPEGHCEYFATALVLMLRSQRIPARLVAGFKTDEWNAMGGFFQVRQLRHVGRICGPPPRQLIRGEHRWEWSGGPGSAGPHARRDNEPVTATQSPEEDGPHLSGSIISGTTTSWRWTAHGSVKRFIVSTEVIRGRSGGCSIRPGGGRSERRRGAAASASGWASAGGR